MRIESLKTAPDRAGRYWVTFEDGTKMGLYRQTVEDHGLYTGKELTDEEYRTLQESAGQMSAKMRAVRIVSASSVSRRDLRDRLIRKGEDPHQAEQAVAWMEELRLVDGKMTELEVLVLNFPVIKPKPAPAAEAPSAVPASVEKSKKEE